MFISEKIKLRLVIWSVIGLGFFHLFFGRYDYYPFIRWTMFSDKEHRQVKTKITSTVVIAIGQDGRERVISLKNMVGSIKGGGGTAKAIEDDYIQELLTGDQELADRFARRAELEGFMQNIAALRVENRTWFIDGKQFLSGELPLVGDKITPDKVRALVTIPTPIRKPEP